MAIQGCFESEINPETNEEIKKPLYKDNEGIDRLEKTFDKFVNDKKIKEVLADPDDAFYSLVQSEFNMPLDEYEKFKIARKECDKKLQRAWTAIRKMIVEDGLR